MLTQAEIRKLKELRLRYEKPQIANITKFPIISKIKNYTPSGMIEFAEIVYKIDKQKICIQMRLNNNEYTYKCSIFKDSEVK